jgi:hypothetical protein
MTAGSEYPKMLFRPGTAMRLWNQYDVDILTVADAAEHEAATPGGWVEHPADAPEKPPEQPKRRGRPRKDES